MKTRHAKFSENEHFLPPDTHSGIFRILLNQRVTKFNRALEVKQSKHKYWKATYIRIFLTHTHILSVLENAVFHDQGISGKPGYYD